MAKKQKEAVVEAVITALGSNFVAGETVVGDIDASELKEYKKEARQIVFDGVLSGDINYTKDLTDEKTIRKYANNVVDNYIRRAKELNAGQSYKPSKEGTKRDLKLKALSALISTGKVVEGTEDYNSVISSIASRKEEIVQERGSKSVKRTEINMDSLPPHLQELAKANLGNPS